MYCSIACGVRIGVSFNKIFAKLGSDMKKPDAITVITEDNFRDKVWPLPASDMIYVGPATSRKLQKYGVTSIGDIAKTSPELMRRWFGVNGLALWNFASGEDHSRVMHREFESPVKSVGHGITCNKDVQTEEELFQLLDEVGRIPEFDYLLSLKVLDRMELQPNGKLSAVFLAGIRITL